MAEVKKADMIYMQNELLSDINSLEKKLSDKITQLSIVIQNQKLISEQNFELSKGNYKILLEKIESNENLDKIKQQFTEFKTKINNNLIVNNSKISSLERELKDIGFKYDNLFNNNISTPGLIGKGGKYKDLRNFREYLDKKINELIIYKEKNIIDIKKYKEKMDNIIGQIQLRTQNNESKYFEFCYEKINEAKKEIMDKFSLLDESINNIKIENGKYSFDLIKKSEDLQNQINTFKNIEQDINTKLKEQSEKYQNYNNDLVKLFESQSDEFKLIKSRFTELSEFIKDVRFMRNLNNFKGKGVNQNNEINSVSFLKDSRLLSKRINFDKPQKYNKNEEIKYEYNKTENDFNKKNEDEEKNKNNKNNIKYNIKQNILNVNNNINNSNNNIKSKEIKSPKKLINNLVINTSTINSGNSSIKKNKDLNNTLISFKKENILDIIDEPIINKKNRNKIIENNNKDDFTRNKSDIYFNRQSKTQENNNKSKNMIFKGVNQNLLKENTSFIFIRNNNSNNINTNNNKNKKKNIKALGYKNSEDDTFNENNNVIYDNNIQLNQNNEKKIYEFIDTQIFDLNKKIKEINEINKHYIDKMNKKLDLYINLNNVLLLKFKSPKNLTNNKINILTNNDYNIPLLNNNNCDKYKLKTERMKLKIKDNSSFLNNKEIKDIKDNDDYQKQNSGKILSIIEPYLIKKFRNDSKG